MTKITTLALLLSAAALPTLAHAQQEAFTGTYVNLRAGPARDFPVVASIGPNVEITVVGCVGDYRWCDVIAGPIRGWAYAGSIVYPYQGSRVALLGYGAAIGIGILVLDLGGYWDEHYRGRPWYGQRERWVERPHGNWQGGRIGLAPIAPGVHNRQGEQARLPVPQTARGVGVPGRGQPERGAPVAGHAMPERGAPVAGRSIPEHGGPVAGRGISEHGAPVARGAMPERGAPPPPRAVQERGAPNPSHQPSHEGGQGAARAHEANGGEHAAQGHPAGGARGESHDKDEHEGRHPA